MRVLRGTKIRRTKKKKGAPITGSAVTAVQQGKSAPMGLREHVGFLSSTFTFELGNSRDEKIEFPTGVPRQSRWRHASKQREEQNILG